MARRLFQSRVNDFPRRRRHGQFIHPIATILLREGFEALLVLAALAAYIHKAGARERLPALYGAAGLAIVASLIAAWLFEAFNNGVHSDVVEGVTILAAAALMLYVSGWLILRQDPRAWQHFLNTKALGLNPTVEAVAAQLAVIAVAVVTVAVLDRRARRATDAARRPA